VKEQPAMQSGQAPDRSGVPRRRFNAWKLVGLAFALLVCAGLAYGVVWLVQWADSPERLVFTPAGGHEAAEELVARMLATNRPWLDPKPLRATYSFRGEYTAWSLSDQTSR
jgi:hypothetical protein